MFKQTVKIIILVWSMMSVPSWADAFGIPLLQPKTDNKLLQLCWEGASVGRPAPAELNQYALYLINGVIPTTGIRIQIFSFCAPLMDMRFNDNLTGNNLLGVRVCQRYATTVIPFSVCVESTVQINPRLIEREGPRRGVPPATGKLSNWCHEGGHAFGMVHASDGIDCLRQGLHTRTSYSSHHIGHIREDISP